MPPFHLIVVLPSFLVWKIGRAPLRLLAEENLANVVKRQQSCIHCGCSCVLRRYRLEAVLGSDGVDTAQYVLLCHQKDDGDVWRPGDALS